MLIKIVKHFVPNDCKILSFFLVTGARGFSRFANNFDQHQYAFLCVFRVFFPFFQFDSFSNLGLSESDPSDWGGGDILGGVDEQQVNQNINEQNVNSGGQTPRAQAGGDNNGAGSMEISPPPFGNGGEQIVISPARAGASPIARVKVPQFGAVGLAKAKAGRLKANVENANGNGQNDKEGEGGNGQDSDWDDNAADDSKPQKGHNKGRRAAGSRADR